MDPDRGAGAGRVSIRRGGVGRKTRRRLREVKVEVEEVNAAPVALAAVVDATEDEQVKIQLKGTDIESSTLTYKSG